MATPRGRTPRGQTRQQTSGQTRGQEEVTEPTGTLFDLASDDDVIYIWRIHPVSKKLVFMFKLSQEEGTEEEIQRLAGGGKYMCREKGRNDDGLMVFGKSRTIEIGGAPREPKIPKATQAEADGAPSAAAAPVVGTIGDGKKGTTIDDVLTAGILRLFTSQAEASETQSKMYQAMLARPHADVDWGKVITALVPLAVSMIEKKSDGPNHLEMIEKVASLMKANTNPTAQFKDMLETVDSVFSIKDQAAGPSADPITSAMEQLPKILEIIQSEQKTRGRIPTPEEVQRRLVKPTQPGNMPMYQQMLNRYSKMLRDWAQRGQDPVQAGEFIVSSIPEKYHGQVQEFLARDDAATLVYQTIPDLRNYPKFTEACFGAMADMFAPDEEEAGDDVPLGGPQPDVAQPTEPGKVVYEVDKDGMGHAVEEEEDDDLRDDELEEIEEESVEESTSEG